MITRTNKRFVSYKKTMKKFTYIPLTLNTEYYGKLLSGHDFIFYLLVINSVNEFQDKAIIFRKSVNSMYLYKNTYIIINQVISSTVINRSVYTASEGILLEKVVDIINTKS